jgi:two-component system, chemotaxis family, sensor kinase CheA
MIDGSALSDQTLEFDLSPDDQGLFLAEVDELLDKLEEALVDMERAPDDQALLNEIFRAAHTIKGSSATIGHARMAALTHAIETRLDSVRKRDASVTPELIEAMLAAVDVLKLLRDEVETRVAADVDVDAAAAAVERRAALRQLPALGEFPTYRLTVTLEEGPWTAVRALQVLLALGDDARVLSSEPSQAEIESEDFTIGTRLAVLVSADKPIEPLLEVVKAVPEVAGVEAELVETRPELPSAPTASSAAQAPRTSSTTIRIDVARLDALLNLVGELVIDRTRLVQLGAALLDQFGDDRVLSDLQQTSLHIGRITDELQDQVMKSRMLPIESVFNRLPRVVRDVAARLAKQVEFSIEGKETELDRSVIEEISDPLLHLIRNAVDHGIETPAEREASGKPGTARLRLSAAHADSFIIISLEDDGKGIDVEAVKRKAVERGVVSSDQAERLSDAEAVQLIFAPGLSTAEKLSDLSGRGVGLDVVRSNVEKINGSVEVHTRKGAGTTFTIRLPLTLAIVQALLVRVASGTFALPIHSVTETLRIEAEQVHRVNQREATLLRDAVLPLVSLRHIFGVGGTGSADGSRLVVAVHMGGRQVGLVVDGLVGEQEIVIKPLGQLVGDVAGVSGAAILGDGSVALILDVAALVGQAIRDNTTIAPLAPRSEKALAAI